MGHDLTIQGLTDKRTELMTEMRRLRAGADKLVLKQQHLEKTLEALGIDLDGKKFIRETFRGENAQVVLSVLANAKRSLTSVEIARRALVQRQFNPEDRRLQRLMVLRVRANLAVFKEKGIVVREDGSGSCLEWRLA